MSWRSPSGWACGLVLALAGSSAFGQASLFTPHHVARVRFVGEAVVSPDGGQVAYVLGVQRQLPKDKDGPAYSELHVVDVRGENTPFITGAGNVASPAWTPDGKSISFLAKRDKDQTRSLYAISVRGGEARKILSHSTDILGYSWSPDGKSVAFLAQESEAKSDKVLKEQGFNQEIYEEENAYVRVWIAEPEGEKPARKLKLKGSASELHWSPAGDRLAVALAPTPLIDDALMFRKVHVVDVTTGKSTNLKNPGKIGPLAWSPDGKSLALVSGEDKNDPLEGRLWIETPLAKGWTDILPDYLGHVENVAWKSPETVVYVASRGVWTEVGTIHLESAKGKIDAGKPKVVVPTGGPILSKLTTSRDGKTLAFVGHSPRHPPEVYLMGPKDKQPRRLTDSNPWMRAMTFAEQEVVEHKARDGMELEGILVRPLDEKKGKRYPLVLTVHGGPESHVPNGWVTTYSQLGQVGAARGFAVFYPNYRGSTGRGVAFSKLGQAAAAGKEFDDLVDAVDHLVKMGLVDTKKVGITGGSYGGYATAWGSTYYSDRFAAGVMFVGISNGVSKVGTTDIPHEMFLVHHRKWLWDDWDYFLKSSPIYHLEKAKTPLLILHGKNDPRVHPSQSLELYRHLKLRGKAPVRLVLYPGEGHGNRRAASRLDYNLRLLRWMEHYLQGPGGEPPSPRIDYDLEPKGKKAAALGSPNSWQRPERSAASAFVAAEDCVLPWLGRGCPCCLRDY